MNGAKSPGRRRSVVRALLLAMMGTGLAMGLVFPLVVAPFADYRPGMRAAFSGLCLAAGLVVGALNFLLVRTFLLRTVERVSAQLEALSRGEGMVTTRLSLDSDDALGRLVARFNALLDRLRDSLARVTETVGAFIAHAEETGSTAHALVASGERKRQVVAGTADLFAGLKGELESLGTAMDRVRESAAESARAAGRQVEQAESVNEGIGELRQANRAGAEGVDRLGEGIRRAGAGTTALTGAIEGASAAAAGLDAALARVEERLRDAAAAAERAAADAGEGDAVARRARESMERIRASVVEAADDIRAFTLQVEEIARVSEVIDDVTDETSLLALNAAIIAAQAGSHGAGFAVVAGQIKELAERTAASTKEIGGLVAAFRDHAAAAIGAMAASRDLVEEGAALARQAGEAFGRLRDGASTSHEHVAAIGGELRGAAEGAHRVAGTMGEIAGRAREIAAATREQESGAAAVAGTAHGTAAAAERIAGAVHRQVEAAREISRQAGRTTSLIEEGRRAIGAIAGQAELLATTIETLQAIDERERGSFDRCERDTGQLARRGGEVRREIERLAPKA